MPAMGTLSTDSQTVWHNPRAFLCLTRDPGGNASLGRETRAHRRSGRGTWAVQRGAGI